MVVAICRLFDLGMLRWIVLVALCLSGLPIDKKSEAADQIPAAWQHELKEVSDGVLVISRDGTQFALITLENGEVVSAANLQYTANIDVFETRTGKREATLKAANATAFELLPDLRVAVLSTVWPGGQGMQSLPSSELLVLRLKTGEEVFRQPLPGFWSSLCASNDGKLLAAGGAATIPVGKEPCVVKVWGAQNFNEVVSLLRKRKPGPLENERAGHLGDPNRAEFAARDDRVFADVSSLAFSTDGKHLLVATYGAEGNSPPGAIIEAWSTDNWLKSFGILSTTGLIQEIQGSRDANRIAWIIFQPWKIEWTNWGGSERAQSREVASKSRIAVGGRALRYASAQEDGKILIGQWGGNDNLRWELPTGASTITSFVMSADGKWVVALCGSRLMGWNLGRTFGQQGNQGKLHREEPKETEQSQNASVRQLLDQATRRLDDYHRGYGGLAFYYASQRKILAARDEALRVGADIDSIMVTERLTLAAAAQRATVALLDREARRAEDLAEQGHYLAALNAIENVIAKSSSDLPRDAYLRYRGVKGCLLACVGRWADAEPLITDWSAWCDKHPENLVDYADSHVGMGEVQLGMGEWGAARASIQACYDAVRTADKERRIDNSQDRMFVGRSLGQGSNILYQIAWTLLFRGGSESDYWKVLWQAREISSHSVSLLDRTEWGIRPPSDRFIVEQLASSAYNELMLGNFEESKALVDAAIQIGVRTSGLAFQDDADYALCELVHAGCSRKHDISAAEKEMDAALESFERILGPDSPTTISARLQRQLLVAPSQPQSADAFSELRACGQSLLPYVVGDLKELEEWKQLGLLRQALPEDLYMVLSLAKQGENGASPAVLGAAEWLANFKGRSLEAMIARIESHRPDTEGNVKPSVAEQRWVEIMDIQNHLDSDEAFIDVARYCPFDGSDWTWRPSRYLAFVVTRDAVHVGDLGVGEEVDQEVFSIRKIIEESVLTIRRRGEKAAEQELLEKIRQLSAGVFGDLNDVLAGKRHWVISPDASLWFLPWEVLSLDGTHYVVEDHSIHYVSTARELLQDHRAESFGSPVVVSAPDYDHISSSNASSGDVVSHRWTQLDGTMSEAREIVPRIAKYTGKKVIELSGKSATENAIRSLVSPQLLVLATHAGRTQSTDDGVTRDIQKEKGVRELVTLSLQSESRDERPENYLMRWSVALAGANLVQSRNMYENSEGLLTSGEILELDLNNTELVVLSACDTGLGDYQEYNVPLDLRHSFRMAGADAVVASLWKVPDPETAQLMTVFFEELSEGKGEAEALQTAECALINQRRIDTGAAHPLFWAAFTVTGVVGHEKSTVTAVTAAPPLNAQSEAETNRFAQRHVVVVAGTTVIALAAAYFILTRAMPLWNK